MGIDYFVSPLSKVRFIDMSGIPASNDAAGLPSMPVDVRVLSWTDLQKHLRSPRKSTILAWRKRLSNKYHSQLAEPLAWNENSAFRQSGSVPSHANVLLQHVAATIDILGDENAAQKLRGRPDAPENELSEMEAQVGRRGYLSRFPQLLLNASYWLPFKRDMIIEEPDWTGRVQRFGSVFKLTEEIAELRSFIQRAEADAVDWTTERIDRDPPTILAQAWQCSDTLLRLSAAAVKQRLPLIWSG